MQTWCFRWSEGKKLERDGLSVPAVTDLLRSNQWELVYSWCLSISGSFLALALPQVSWWLAPSSGRGQPHPTWPLFCRIWNGPAAFGGLRERKGAGKGQTSALPFPEEAQVTSSGDGISRHSCLLASQLCSVVGRSLPCPLLSLRSCSPRPGAAYEKV